MATHYRVIIVGSGPAGLTAALYCSRANLKPLCIEGGDELIPPGGQLMITTEVENYPGFPKGVDGKELMAAFRAQAERFGTTYLGDKGKRIDVSKRPFTVETEWSGSFTADAVIVSTGANPRLLGLPSEKALFSRGVHTCATCDGHFYRGKKVVVVGGGDTAIEEANYLTRVTEGVTVIHRRDALRASKIMQDRALHNPKLTFHWSAVPEEFLAGPENKLSGVRVKSTRNGQTEVLPCAGAFIAIGHRPNTEFLKGVLDMDENGYLLVKGQTSYTNVEGVFACGDCVDHRYRQAVTAAGMGCMAAIDAERWLEAQGR